MVCCVSGMRMTCITVMAAVFAMTGCNRDSNEPAARQMGREAYKFKEKSKAAAKELGHELREASREAREGWNEAKRNDAGHPRKNEDLPPKPPRR